MGTPARLTVVLLALGAVCAATRPAPAAACTLPADSIVVTDPPANGVVVVNVRCYSSTACFEGELPDELEVVELISREPVPGSIERIEGSLASEAKIAWRPDQPLVARRQYEVLWQPTASFGFADTDYVFDALPEASWDASAIVLQPQLWMTGEVTESVSCEVRAPTSCGFSNEPGSTSIPLERRSFPMLALNVDAQRSPGNSAEQFVLSAAFWGQGEAEPELQEQPWLELAQVSHAFDAAADAYCYRVEVTSLIDDSVATQEGCEEHGDLGMTGISAVPEDENRHLIAQCAEAPEGLKDVWCRGRAEQCASSAACDVPAECEGVSEGDAGQMSDAGQVLDAGDMDDDDDVTPELTDGVKSSGCNCSVQGGAGYSADGLIWCAALALLARRRRG